MSKTININGESKVVEKVALWRDAGHTERETFVPEGTVPDGYVLPETPEVSVSIAKEGGRVVARASAEANGMSGSGESSVLPGSLGLEDIGTISEGYVLPTSRIPGQTIELGEEPQTLPEGAYLDGDVVIPALPEVEYETPTVTASVALSQDGTKVVASSTASANGMSGSGSAEALLSSLDANLAAGNIKSGVSIFGVLGTLAAGGGLPAGVDIATNTHTFTNDAGYLNLSINMSAAPTLFFIFTDDFGSDSTANHVKWSIYLLRNERAVLCRANTSDGALSTAAGQPSAAQLSMTKTSITLGVAGNNANKRFVGGKTYTWVAVAI